MDIYHLKEHELLQTPDFQVLRVAGGWIYRFWNYEKQDYYPDATFVPYNSEYRRASY